MGQSFFETKNQGTQGTVESKSDLDNLHKVDNALLKDEMSVKQMEKMKKATGNSEEAEHYKKAGEHLNTVRNVVDDVKKQHEHKVETDQEQVKTPGLNR